MKLKLFDRKKLELRSLSQRKHDLDYSVVLPLNVRKKPAIDKKIKTVAERIIRAKRKQGSVILMMGGHVIRSGVQNYIIDLMQRGYISCLALNGSGIIHDFELALIGATTESVAKYIKEGQFGLWKETGRINDIMNRAYKKNKTAGLGEAIGEYIEKSKFRYKSLSLLAAAYRFNIPATVHVGIGYDIIHEHPNCDGAATGALSYNDFLRFAYIVQNIENGVIMNFGSAIMAPEVFLKALSMARNVARQEGREIRHFTALVCDLLKLPDNISKEPSKDDRSYYFRPWKTMLVRTVADGGESFYVQGKHDETIPGLWTSINKGE